MIKLKGIVFCAWATTSLADWRAIESLLSGFKIKLINVPSFVVVHLYFSKDHTIEVTIPPVTVTVFPSVVVKLADAPLEAVSVAAVNCVDEPE